MPHTGLVCLLGLFQLQSAHNYDKIGRVMLKSNSHKKQEVHFMDITANNKHRYATKSMNTKTVNYTSAYTLCLLVLFAVKQL